MTAYSGSMPLEKNHEKFLRNSRIDAGIVVLHVQVSRSVRRQRGLGDRVGTRFGDVVAGDAHEVVVPDVMIDVVFRNVPHQSEGRVQIEHEGVLAHRFLELVRLYRTSHRAQGPGSYPRTLLIGWFAALVLDELGHLLPDGDREERRKVPPVVAVDRLGNAGVGVTEVEALEQALHLIHGRDRHTRFAHLPEDVEPRHGVPAVEGRGIERRRESVEGLALGEEMESAIGALGASLPGEHPHWQLIGSLEREDPSSEGEGSGAVLGPDPRVQVAPIGGVRERHPRPIES